MTTTASTSTYADADADADADAAEQARSDPRTAVTCSTCGTTAEQQPLTWSMGHGPRGSTLTCDRCTRANLRAMEAKLDEEFW